MDVDTILEMQRSLSQDGRYPLSAYDFLHDGLRFTTERLYGRDPEPGPHHVSGSDLCCGLRDLAVERWGPLARLVLSRWGIRSTRDFGEMVFLLVRIGMLGKQDSDQIEDFDDVYDFDEAFGAYAIPIRTLEGPTLRAV